MVFRNGGKDDKWSYSWAVAHSLRWYLASGKGIKVERVKSARNYCPVISFAMIGMETEYGSIIRLWWDITETVSLWSMPIPITVKTAIGITRIPWPDRKTQYLFGKSFLKTDRRPVFVYLVIPGILRQNKEKYCNEYLAYVLPEVKPGEAVNYFILVLTLVVLVSWLPCVLNFIIQKGENDYISITWQIIPPIWGITLEIPFIKISPTEVWPILKIITQLEGEKGQTLGEHEKNIPLNQYRFKRFLEKASFVLTRTGELTTLGKWFISKITLREFSWCTEIGTDEAGKTGILVGIIWAIKALFTVIFILWSRK